MKKFKRPDNYEQLLSIFYRHSEEFSSEQHFITEFYFDVVLDELLKELKPCEKYDLKPIADLMTDALNKLNRLT